MEKLVPEGDDIYTYYVEICRIFYDLNLNPNDDIYIEMSHISCIFTLKPIVDLLHGDVLIYVSEITSLKERIAELERENNLLREINSTPIKIEPIDNVKEVIVTEEKPRNGPKIASKNIVIDDVVYSKEAESFTEPVNIVVENTEKVVVLNQEKSRKEYQQEYQRQYRKQQKEKQQQVIQ